MILVAALDTALLDSLWMTARMWRAGSNVEKVDSARSRIIGAGGEAVRYVVLKYLPADDHLQTRAIRDICEKVPDTCAPAVDSVLRTGDTVALKNALYVASEVRMPSLEGTLLKLLRGKRDGRWKARILRALYKSGSRRACDEVAKYARHPYEYVRMRVLLFIGEHGCRRYKRLLWEGLNDSLFIVRDAGRESLVKMGFGRVEFEEHLGKVRTIELLKLLYFRCPSRDYLYLIEPKNPFERYWYGRIKCD
ncbi:MAG: HEAT repeat domain-containing protein [Thermotogae bacterium]|nr:HEAT repeat domain-containing protein [Thermotogota bacterium]